MSKQITGSIIDERYKVTGYLRDGRMGNVYVARRLENDERVAIKMLDPSLFGQEEAMRRFERELRVQSKIQHPNSTQVFESGRTEDGLPWLAMEYSDGELLSDVIEEREALPPAVACQIAGQIASALEAAHDIGIVHRDLSPENILLVDPEGDRPTVKVLDFALAGVVDHAADEDTSLTAVGIRVGTPFYMAPEYIEDFECDHRADLYALGIVIHEMITGEPPFTGRPYKVMDKHVNAPPPRLNERPDVPDWLDDLLQSLLAKRPDDRPPTARAVVATLEKNGAFEESAQDTMGAPEITDTTDTPEPEQTGVGMTLGDPVLDRVRQRLLMDVDRTSGSNLNPRDCLVCERISKYSLLASYGMKPGTLVHVEQLGEGLLDPTLLDKPHVEITYRFVVEQEVVRVRTKSALLGVNFARSVENIRTYYNPTLHGHEPMFELWRQAAWPVLERVARRAMGQTQGLFSRLVGSSLPKAIDDPATLFFGTALVEQGRGDEGFPYVKEFKSQYAGRWSSTHQAIATAYMGLQRIQAGARDLGIELLLDAYKLKPLRKIKRALEKTTGKAPEFRALYKRRFPTYDLYQTNGRPGARLADVLGQMDQSQVLLIVLLGGFRGNEIYNQITMRYMNVAAHLHDFVAGMHVATTVKDRTNNHNSDWFTGEDLAIQAGLPFLVLEDYRAFVQREAKPVRIPTVYAVNRQGLVLHEGDATSADLWNAIGRAGQLRMHNLQKG